MQPHLPGTSTTVLATGSGPMCKPSGAGFPRDLGGPNETVDRCACGVLGPPDVRAAPRLESPHLAQAS